MAVYIQQVMWNRYRGNIAHRENTIARYWRGKHIGYCGRYRICIFDYGSGRRDIILTVRVIGKLKSLYLRGYIIRYVEIRVRNTSEG